MRIDQATSKSPTSSQVATGEMTDRASSGSASSSVKAIVEATAEKPMARIATCAA